MLKVYRSVAEVCWVLGVITLAVSVVLRIVPSWGANFGVSPRSGLILAAVLFLCVIAAGTAGKTPPSS